VSDARAIVIIPARGGSKGIPRKNVRSLRGQPLIAYAIGTALASRHHPDVVVSSDDP
jgi:CMP-N-acetylneuraminic acid synthetase